MAGAALANAIRAGGRAAMTKALGAGQKLTAQTAKAAAKKGLAKITEKFRLKVKKLVSGTDAEDHIVRGDKGMKGAKGVTKEDDDGSVIYKPQQYAAANMMHNLGDPPGGKPTSLSKTSTVIVDIQRLGYN